MAEYAVRIWRRTEPLLGSRARIKNLERDEVSVEAPNPDSALGRVYRAECAEYGKRVRICVRVDTPEGDSYGLGDLVLIELANTESEESRAFEFGNIEK